MEVIRDEEMSGLLMIPLFQQYGLNRCNIAGCKEKQTTICIHEQATFALCENHYKEYKQKGIVKLKLEFT